MGRLCLKFAVILGVLAMALLVSPALSLTCTSQKFSNKNDYPKCTDLPHLGAFLHWNFNASNSSLSMAFIAPPAKTGGWVAWAINPNSTGMAGSQALLAFKPNGGAVTIQTYDIKSYMFNMSGMNLSYPVWDLKAEESSSNITIYGKWKLPAKMEKLNQVWQVGPGITPNGYPIIHNTNPENLKATGTLNLVTAAATSPAPEPAAASGPSGSPAPGPGSAGSTPSPGSSGGNNGVSRNRDRAILSLCMPLFVILGSLIVF
ncbi:auxin-induced in root cultures protein 12-like [Juglans regia]|uniref:Auxin-induced in root cultures protein 12-like n=2 Tax=Juglans regia TaxID=51240 RepID=A0A2I4GJS6_JUGRE|nr:auxin-induced in root cultures protein 12-like [Juglans regia]